MVLYHNTRCSKSRETLQLLESKNVNPEIVEYMKEPITPGDLEEILDKLDMDAIDLVRKKEAIWKEEFADKELTEDEVILAMIEYPQLMERPILVNGDKARVGRPPEDVLEII
ncbi:arsenate reductase (glutaredoxin) [Owenweeksia hongkongensis]|uniref:arsenate reductase (glutaredoxin) n=1 Tax=Owenweeksia hongkongensis TaxID=253245 RepID=UPI003A950DFE